jgi:hypothetical protein
MSPQPKYSGKNFVLNMVGIENRGYVEFGLENSCADTEAPRYEDVVKNDGHKVPQTPQTGGKQAVTTPSIQIEDYDLCTKM